MTVTEISLFIPRSGERLPLEIARELVETLNVGRAVLGEDLLAGGITLSLPYDPKMVTLVRTFFAQRSIDYELELR